MTVMSRPRRASAWLLAFVVLALAVVPAVATAGTYGQQIALATLQDGSYRICGINQNGPSNQNGQNTCVARNVTLPSQPVALPYSLLRKYWWRGTVTIQHYASPGLRGPLGVSRCAIPASQQGSDWTVCAGIKPRGYPYDHAFPKLGGKVYRVLSDQWVFDPLYRLFVPRDYVFGYWDHHVVYKLNDHVGVDIKTRQIVIAEERNHWVILHGAREGYEFCGGDGMNTVTGRAEAVVMAIQSWCGVAGAMKAMIGTPQPDATPAPTATPMPTPTPTPVPTPAPTVGPPGPNLLQNPSFNTGNPAPWYRNNHAGNVNVVDYVTPSLSQDGGGFLATNTSVPGGSIAQDLAVAPVPGHTYTFSLWLRSRDGTPMSATVAAWALGTSNVNGSRTVTVAGTWQQVAVQLAVPGVGSRSLRAEVYMGTTHHTVNLDNATFTA